MSKTNLGVWDCPAGGCKEYLTVIHSKVDKWITPMKNGNLLSHMTWVAYKLQLWVAL